jgi:transcriptional regulator with XRE-family HTH domain
MTTSSPRPTLGQVIRSRRLALGISQEALAARVSDLGSEINQADISRIELGKVELPRRRRLEYLAAALELTLGELLEASGWIGASERFGAWTAEASPVLQPSTTIGTDLTHGPGAQPPSEWPPLAPRDTQATLEAIWRLRTAITQAQEPVERASSLLRKCQETARRWDPGATRQDAATLERVPRLTDNP